MVDLLLNLQAPHRHLVEVSLRLVPRTPVLRLRLPAWTPGSYLIRDYVRHLEGLEVRQGDRLLAVQRLGAVVATADADAGRIEQRRNVVGMQTIHREGSQSPPIGLLLRSGATAAGDGSQQAPGHRLYQRSSQQQAHLPRPTPGAGAAHPTGQ